MSILKTHEDSLDNETLDLLDLNLESALISLDREFQDIDKNLNTLLNIAISGKELESGTELDTQSAKIILETYVKTTNNILGFNFFEINDEVTIESAFEDGIKKAWEFIKKFISNMIRILKELGNKIKDVISKIIKSKTVEVTQDTLLITKEISNIKNSLQNITEETTVEKEINKDLKIEMDVENKKIKTIRIYKRAELRKTIKKEEKIDIKQEVQKFVDEHFTKDFISNLSTSIFGSNFDTDMDDIARRFLYGFGFLINDDNGVKQSLMLIKKAVQKIGEGDIEDLISIRNKPFSARAEESARNNIDRIMKTKITHLDIDKFVKSYTTQQLAVIENINAAYEYVISINDTLSECYEGILKKERNIKTNDDIKYVELIKKYLSIFKDYSDNLVNCINLSVKFQSDIAELALKNEM